MSVIVALIAQVLHIALMLLTAPAVGGSTDWLEARLAGRSGQPFLQPWRDLIRLTRKTAAFPESASGVLLFAPAVSLGATLSAAALIPSFTLGTALAPLADGLVIASLLSVARVAMVLGALDTGSAAPGVAAQSNSTLAVVSEPALLLIVFSLALMGGSFNLDPIIGQQREGMLLPVIASVFALTSLLALILVDISDASVGLDLDYSGVDLAVVRVTNWLRRLVWIDLIVGLFLPVGIAGRDGSLLEWGIGLVCWAIKLVAAIIALSFFRAVSGHVTRQNMPDLVGAAVLLALLATIMVLATAGTA